MMCAKKRVERRVARDTGEMRPFAYWEKIGYCPERLRTHTPEKDRTYTEQGGEMCRVWVDTKICETEVIREMEEILSKFKKRRAIKADVKQVKETLKRMSPPGADDAASSSSSDNSSSSSSSSSSHRKKKGKKDKKKKAKAAKAQEKEKKAAQKRKAAAKEDAKKSKLAHKHAEQSAKAMDKAMKATEKAKTKQRDNAIEISGKALTRLQCLKSKLEGLLFEDLAGETIRVVVMEKFPEFARTKVMQSYVTIRTMTELALQCLSEPTVDEIGYKMEDIRSAEKDGNESINMLSSL
jgi:flagellar biosynthesis GTPase FlhF